MNTITDVAGVRVGHTTLISGAGPLVVGQGPVRTGVTVIQPRAGDAALDPVFAGYHILNGNGEMTGTAWIEELGTINWPIAITNTHSVGVVRDALIAYNVAHGDHVYESTWSLPVVAETYDGTLSDINGMHVRPEHVFAALDAAAAGPVAEGCVGGGTGMLCHGFKGGIGTSSRVVGEADGGWTVGALTPLFEAAADATEEAILNALCMATTTTGVDGRVAHAIPLERLREVLRYYRRLEE